MGSQPRRDGGGPRPALWRPRGLTPRRRGARGRRDRRGPGPGRHRHAGRPELREPALGGPGLRSRRFGGGARGVSPGAVACVVSLVSVLPSDSTQVRPSEIQVIGRTRQCGGQPRHGEGNALLHERKPVPAWARQGHGDIPNCRGVPWCSRLDSGNRIRPIQVVRWTPGSPA